MNFITFDLETTAREPEEAHVIEWAAVYLDGIHVGEDRGFVRPPVPIPPETSAIHQIIDADVESAPDWNAVKAVIVDLIVRLSAKDNIVLVAHNTSVEKHFLAALSPTLPWICTYKSALRVWPDAPSHSNEGLRYFLGLNNLGRGHQQQPHSALHDASVTAQILGRLLCQVTVNEMFQWEQEPAMLPRCPIGKYRDLPWAEIPADWLDWCVYKTTDMREDVLFCAKQELQRRRSISSAAITADDDDDLPF